MTTMPEPTSSPSAPIVIDEAVRFAWKPVAMIAAAAFILGGAAAVERDTRTQLAQVKEQANQADKKIQAMETSGADRLGRIETKVDLLLQRAGVQQARETP